jgi:hypothetical protein
MNTIFVRRNLCGNNISSRPLRVASLSGLIMAVLMFMMVAGPSAHAVIELTDFDFENAANRTTFNNGGSYPADSGQTTVNLTNQTFPSGNIEMLATGGNPNGVLDLSGENNINKNTIYCFVIGPINDTGTTDQMLSFDMLSTGNGGQYSTLTLGYNTTSASGPFTNFATITINQNGTYNPYNENLSADGVPTSSTLYIQWCFSTTHGNNATGNDTRIDNIEFTAVPEPTTAIGGALVAVGLCWSQRRRLSRALRLRRA